MNNYNAWILLLFMLYLCVACNRSDSELRDGESSVESGKELHHPQGTESDVNNGKELYLAMQCQVCHGESGGGGYLAPPFPRIGEVVQLQDGEARFDDAFIRESILYPSAALRKGWENSMPPYEFSSEQLDNLVGFIRTLTSGKNG